MRYKTGIVLALAAATLLPAAALAADYDPPIYVDEAPEYVPVEVGSGWYLRGDVGYAFKRNYKNEAFAADERKGLLEQVVGRPIGIAPA